ncbi:hypothetical protein [Klebsiella aerogenes]|uniref:hypothetical protein n=1 Tax=Klebsiella aerogenes TaxID=548 RepID=UPI001908A47F|nr:hypothetical protein [Klebsiella aerogenes]MBK0469638.1 hypothetical protein [Klebsiella aerogenes]
MKIVFGLTYCNEDMNVIGLSLEKCYDFFLEQNINPSIILLNRDRVDLLDCMYNDETDYFISFLKRIYEITVADLIIISEVSELDRIPPLSKEILKIEGCFILDGIVIITRFCCEKWFSKK